MVNIIFEKYCECSLLNKSLTANSKQFYFDYKDGKYGFNTSSTRGADTFVPFSSSLTKIGSYNGRNQQTISCTNIPNYNSLTADNFYIIVTGQRRVYEGSSIWNQDINSVSLTKTYNASSGILTISSCVCGASNGFTCYSTYDVYYN